MSFYFLEYVNKVEKFQKYKFNRDILLDIITGK